ncbi:MAG: ABC transporter substrate-binding protein [Alphaproteobacteria bacterium]
MRWGAIFAVAAWIAAAAPAAAETPVAVVTRFCETLAAVMREGGTLGLPLRAHRLERAIERAFDVEHMTRTAVGPAWQEMTPALRARLVRAVRRATALDYASLYDRDGAPMLVVLPDATQRPDGVMVETRVLPTPDDDPIVASYLVHHGPRGWRIVDVLLFGTTSAQATRRAEYSSLIRQRGPEGLVALLENLGRLASTAP